MDWKERLKKEQPWLFTSNFNAHRSKKFGKCFGESENKKLIDFIEKELKRQRRWFVKKVKRLKLDADIIVCDCGEPYKDSDLAMNINDLLKQLEEE